MHSMCTFMSMCVYYVDYNIYSLSDRVAASFHSTSHLRSLGEFFEDPNEVDIDKDKATVGKNQIFDTSS